MGVKLTKEEEVKVLLREYRRLKRGTEALPAEWESFTGFARAAGEALRTAARLRRPATMLSLVKVDPGKPWSEENLDFTTSTPCFHSAKAKKVAYEGELLSLATVAARSGVSESILRQGMRKGLTVETIVRSRRGEGVYERDEEGGRTG